jgi:zinc protease
MPSPTRVEIRMTARCLIALLGSLALLAPLRADAPKPDPNAELLATIADQFKAMKVATLDNGLRVYLLPVPSSPVVTTMVAYKVGSGDEEKDQTGLSHYLEHLLFKGTDKLMPGDIDRATQRNGGRNNAYTTEDMTVYHFDFAADRWKRGLEIEAERMRGTRIDAKHEFEQEKGAVVSELKGGEDQPWELEYKAILPLLFAKADPYSHPVIGREKHVRAATAEVIKRHYDKWYHPNNAALVVCGGFDADDALATVKKLFGGIPKADLPKRKDPTKTEPRTKQVRKEFESKFDVARLMIGYNTVRAGDAEDYVLDVIDDLLSGGKTARLYKRLVEGDGLANDVGTQNNAGRHPGWFAVQVEMLKGKDRRAAERAAFEEVAKLAETPVSADELKRVRRRMLAAFLFGKESVHEFADLIATGVTDRDLDYVKTYLDRLLKVTPDDVQRVAKELLAPGSAVVVWSVPPDDPAPVDKQVSIPRPASVGAPLVGARLDGHPQGVPPRGRIVGRGGQNRDTGPVALDLTKAKRVVLKNGLVALLLENRRLPIVVADVVVTGVRLREPADLSGVMALTGDMLEEGTDTHTGEQIAAIIEATGGSLSVSAAGGTVKVLTPDTDTGLGLLFECLTRPTFPKEALERKRAQLLSVIADVETQPQNRARQALNAAVYGDHPFGRSAYGSKAVVGRLTAADLKAFHTAAVVPDRTIVAVAGDFDTDAMVEKLEALTADWKPAAGAKAVSVPAPPKDGRPGEFITPDPTAEQTHVYIGHLGVKRDDPDYYALLVMDNVLGVGPGFTDRLSSTLRDRQGLAYTVTASVTGTASDQPGLFVGYIGTFATKYQWVREGFLKEVARIRDEAPTDREVADAKSYLVHSLPFTLTTNESIAGMLVAVERYGLGLDHLATYRAKVGAVTAADVQRVAKKHLDPKKLTISVVGPLGTDGKPLDGKKER